MSLYEMHCTFDPVPELIRKDVEWIAGIHGFHLAKLLMDKGVPSQLDTFMTAHGDEYTACENKIISLAEDLNNHFPFMKLRRYKVERIEMDSRQGDKLNLITHSGLIVTESGNDAGSTS